MFYPLTFDNIQEHLVHIMDNREFYNVILNPTNKKIEDELKKEKEEKKVLKKTLKKTEEENETYKAALEMTVKLQNREIESLETKKTQIFRVDTNNNNEVTVLERKYSQMSDVFEKTYKMMIDHCAALGKWKGEIQSLDDKAFEASGLEMVSYRKNNTEESPLQIKKDELLVTREVKERKKQRESNNKNPKTPTKRISKTAKRKSQVKLEDTSKPSPSKKKPAKDFFSSWASPVKQSVNPAEILSVEDNQDSKSLSRVPLPPDQIILTDNDDDTTNSEDSLGEFIF